MRLRSDIPSKIGRLPLLRKLNQLLLSPKEFVPNEAYEGLFTAVKNRDCQEYSTYLALLRTTAVRAYHTFNR